MPIPVSHYTVTVNYVNSSLPAEVFEDVENIRMISTSVSLFINHASVSRHDVHSVFIIVKPSS